MVLWYLEKSGSLTAFFLADIGDAVDKIQAMNTLNFVVMLAANQVQPDCNIAPVL
jgi:hypothetical protein